MVVIWGGLFLMSQVPLCFSPWRTAVVFVILTDLAPPPLAQAFEFPFPGSLISTFLAQAAKVWGVFSLTGEQHEEHPNASQPACSACERVACILTRASARQEWWCEDAPVLERDAALAWMAPGGWLQG